MKALKITVTATLLALGLSVSNVALAGDGCTGLNIQVNNQLNEEIRVTKISYRAENKTRVAARNNKRISAGQADHWGPKRFAKADGDRVTLIVDYYRTNRGRGSAAKKYRVIHRCQDNSTYEVSVR